MCTGVRVSTIGRRSVRLYSVDLSTTVGKLGWMGDLEMVYGCITYMNVHRPLPRCSNVHPLFGIVYRLTVVLTKGFSLKSTFCPFISVCQTPYRCVTFCFPEEILFPEKTPTFDNPKDYGFFWFLSKCSIFVERPKQRGNSRVEIVARPHSEDGFAVFTHSCHSHENCNRMVSQLSQPFSEYLDSTDSIRLLRFSGHPESLRWKPQDTSDLLLPEFCREQS